MKKTLSAILILAFTFSLSGCLSARKHKDIIESHGSNDISVTTETIEETEEVEIGPNYQTFIEELGNPAKPETVEVHLSGICRQDINDCVYVDDLYGIDYLHSGVGGLLGSPIDLDYNDVKNPELTFVYDPEQLGPIPEKNLILLHYSEEGFYYTMESVTDMENHTVTAKIKEGGVYLLADAYQWYVCWDIDVSDYEYEVDPTTYVSAWEREQDTGDILLLADIEWAIDNAPYFTVSTPEELASVVYYVNVYSNAGSITFDADIDLTGYKWVPMGWTGPSGSYYFTGTIDGQGHTIKGMTIDGTGYYSVGFLGYSFSTDIKDLNFEDAYVSGGNVTGIVGGEMIAFSTWKNVTVQGEMRDLSNKYGSLVGWDAGVSYIDCSADVTYDGEPVDFFSYQLRCRSEIGETEEISLTLNDDFSITREDVEGYRNLSWNVELDGVTILIRNAENELTLDPSYWYDGMIGKHIVYLTAWKEDCYVRVSNIIEYED